MVRSISVQTIIKQLGEGSSDPAVVIGDDFQKYVMKTQRVFVDGKHQFYDSMFLNELLVYQIAVYLGVPVPEATIAYLDREIVQNDPRAVFAHRFFEGKHFASEEISDLEDNVIENYNQMARMGKPYLRTSWKNFFRNVSNKNDIAKIVAMDILVGNYDRNSNTGNLLVTNEGFVRRIIAIDHGHAFQGPTWTPERANALTSVEVSEQYVQGYARSFLVVNFNQGYLNGMGTVYNAIEEHINVSDMVNHSFLEVVHKIEQIDENLVESWLESVPDVWYVNKEYQKRLYKQYILTHKVLVRYIIQDLLNRGAFSNSIGGVLKWKEKENAGTA
ncbi:HipA family kinase [Bacillus sp. 1P06AnD]|uniref:HipA family kinase n=1 Tax=Bacillus sp. 1P06AnD TaxID=3132208 RepID=UPI00399FCFED